MKVSSVEEMRALDRKAVDLGVTEDLLMENAGQALSFALEKEFGIKGRKFLVFSGAGNNGGDGFVIARKIHSNGGNVKVFLLGDSGKYKGAAKANFDILNRLPVEVRRIESSQEVDKEVRHCDAIVDAVFGTGIGREVQGIYRDVIELVNESGKKVMSVDIPSGVNGDTGRVMGTAVKANCTVTLGLPKFGNLLYPGSALCGNLYVSHISFSPPSYEDLKAAVNTPPVLPYRDPDGHKGSFGDVLFVSGAASYQGAPYFSALSFMKAGGGYARLATPKSVAPFIASKGSEIVFAPQKETRSGSISGQDKDALLELAEKVDLVVIGPGVSLDEETQRLIRELAAEIRKPLIIDGDGLTAVSEDLQIVRDRKGKTVLTPHPGEMSRIANLSISEVLENRVEVLRRTANDLNAFVVLKGAHSLIGYPDERIFINMSGNPGMATAGSGDVLNGVIAAMYGLGLPVPEAVRKGVFIHGFAGDLAADDMGEDGITAQEIMDYLPLAMKIDREGLSLKYRPAYEGAQVIV